MREEEDHDDDQDDAPVPDGKTAHVLLLLKSKRVCDYGCAKLWPERLNVRASGRLFACSPYSDLRLTQCKRYRLSDQRDCVCIMSRRVAPVAGGSVDGTAQIDQSCAMGVTRA